jgi:AraC-like DNA-binding protein
LVFMRARDCHSFSIHSKKTPLRMVNIAFAVRTWMKLRDRYELQDVFSLSRDHPLELSLSDRQLFMARSAGADLAAGRVDRLATDRFLLNLVRLAEGSGAESYSDQIPFPSWLRRTLASFSDPSAKIPNNTQELCQLADRSPEHVARVFQRVLNQTPTDFLNNAKLANAATRLISGDDSILQISLAAGFENLGHFYTLFRRKFGHTPRVYRLQQQQITDPRSSDSSQK